MDASSLDIGLSATYETLLTTLCQCDLASAWAWCLPVSDRDAARRSVVTWALAFGEPPVQWLAAMLDRYVDHARIQTPLAPLVCRGDQLGSVLHITLDSTKLSRQLDGKDLLLWDGGYGRRLGRLLETGQTKGQVDLTGGDKLYQFAAGAAQWLVGRLRTLHRDYVAFVAADQVLCLSDADVRELETHLEAASSQEPDVIFFDGPPALSLLRLRFLLDTRRPPRRDGTMALARDRQMLRNYGGAHVFQCVLLKKGHARALVDALDAVLEAARSGYDMDLGVGDIAVLPTLIGAKWLKRQQGPAVCAVQAAIDRLCARGRSIRSVSMPLQVFNVNTPSVLTHLSERIRCDKDGELQP